MTLSACSTVPEVTTSECPVTASSLLVTAPKLRPLKGPMTQSEVAEAWVGDIEQYNLVASRYNLTLQWLHERCWWPKPIEVPSEGNADSGVAAP